MKKRKVISDRDRINFIEKHFELHIMQGYDECDPKWEIQKTIGNINDRENIILAEGETLRETIDKAIVNSAYKKLVNPK